MKKSLLFTLFAFVFVLFMNSCSVQKRYHRKGFNLDWNQMAFAVKNKKQNNKNKSEVESEQNIVEQEVVSEKLEKKLKNTKVSETYIMNQTLDVASTNNSVIPKTHNESSLVLENKLQSKNENAKAPKAKKKTKQGLIHKVITKRINKSIENIKTASSELKKPVKEGETKFHWAALTGFITSLVGLFVSPIILGITAIVFSAIGLAAIKRNPEVYKGKGFALAGLIVGVIDVVLIFLLLVLLLALV